MDKLQDYIKPELLVLIPVLYILGLMMKKTEKINDKYIPVMLGIIGIVLSAIYVAAVSGICHPCSQMHPQARCPLLL